MSDLGYNCLYCRPSTGAMSPRPLSPEMDAPTSVTSPPVVKEEEKTYMVDGICLSEVGLSAVKEITLEPPPALTPAQKAAHAARQAKHRQMKIKLNHPQMSQLLSTAGSQPGSGRQLLLVSVHSYFTPANIAAFIRSCAR